MYGGTGRSKSLTDCHVLQHRKALSFLIVVAELEGGTIDEHSLAGLVHLLVLVIAHVFVWLVEVGEEAIAPERAIVSFDIVVSVFACEAEVLDVFVGLEVAGDQLDDLSWKTTSAAGWTE